jgi:putative two-component system response regulator
MDNILLAEKWIEHVFGRLERSRPWTATHGNRAGELFTIIAAPTGLPREEIAMCQMAMQIHDLGKLLIPLNILMKPGPLNSWERKIVEQHPRLGVLVLKFLLGSNCPEDLKERAKIIILSHHERIDGGGYPYKLRGSQISLCLGIVGIADVLDAMTSRRPYRAKPLSFEKAWEITDGRWDDGRKIERHHPEALEAAKAVLDQLFKKIAESL